MNCWFAVAALAFGCAGVTPPTLGVFSPGSASASRKAKLVALRPELDQVVEETLEKSHATGLVVGIVVDGELVYAKGAGVRDATSHAPVDVDTVFRIASMTKSFTAMAVLKLRDEGRLSLDDPAHKYLPELASLPLPTADAPAITIRMLLTHSAGLPWDDQWAPVSFGFSSEDLSRLIRSGIAFGAVSSTVWEATDVAAERLAVAYTDRLLPEVRPSDGVFAPAGGLYTSLRDYARYVAFQLSAYPPRDDPEVGPVRRSTIREMHQGQRETREFPLVRRDEQGITLAVRSYGFGWLRVTTCADDGRIQHGGWEPGYFSAVVLVPRDGVGIVTFATSHGSRLAIDLLDVIRKAGAMPPPIESPPPAALTEARDMVDRLIERWDEALATRIFDPGAAKYDWYGRLRENFEKLTRDHGQCRADGPLKVDGRLHATWHARCERGAVDFDVRLTPTAPPRVQMIWWDDAADGDAICWQ